MRLRGIYAGAVCRRFVVGARDRRGGEVAPRPRRAGVDTRKGPRSEEYHEEHSRDDDVEVLIRKFLVLTLGYVKNDSFSMRVCNGLIDKGMCGRCRARTFRLPANTKDRREVGSSLKSSRRAS